MNSIGDKWQGLPFYDRPLGSNSDDSVEERRVLYVTDFSRCEPATAVGEGRAQWAIQSYETELFGGDMLTAPRNDPAPDVTLPLNVSGWYAVYVWLMGGDVDLEKQFPSDWDSVYSISHGPALKLSQDMNFSGRFRPLTHDHMMWPGLEGCFWKHADLSGQSLTIRHQGSTVYLGALQLVPLSPAEVEAVQRDRVDTSNKRLILKGDLYAPRDLEYRIEHFRDRDVRAWITGSDETEDLMTPGGSPKLRAFQEACAEIAAECWICERPSLWSIHMPWHDARAKWFAQHPQFHCKDRDGTDTHQASYSVPEVVDYMLERLRAAARLGIDGYGYFFHRDPGLVLFEPAAMKGFEEKHGVDPLTLPDRDERLLDWRADIITGYMRRVRETLDEVATEVGCDRIKSIAVVLGDRAANRFFSLDIERWVHEGLVDVLMPYPWTDYPDRWLAQGFVDVDVKYFAGLVKDTPCKVYPMWLSGIWRSHWTPEHVRMNEYFTKALRDYNDGADGITAWDEVGLDTAFRADRWLRLGHREQLAEWIENDFPLPPKLRFTKLGGVTPDRYPEGTGG